MDAGRLQTLVDRLRSDGTDSSAVEAKRAESKLPKSVRETLSSFANTTGGVVVLGLDESSGFEAVGVRQAPKILADLGACCAEDLHPPIRPESIEIVPFEDVDLIVAEIGEIPDDDKPCYVKAKGKEAGSFIRTADGDRRMTTHEISTFATNRSQPRDDEQVIDGASLDDLDAAAVDALVARLRTRDSIRFDAGVSDVTLLATVGAIVDRDGELVPTLAGLLALGRFPQRFFPQLNVTFVHHPTVDGRQLPSGDRFLDNQRIDGSIPEMTRRTLEVLRRNMSRRAVIDGDGRLDVTEYPVLALREAVVNALIHRDLRGSALGTQVQVDMYPDRIVIFNPGGLWGPANIEEIATGERPSSSRNARLVGLLEDVTLPGESVAVCENRGSGIRTMQQAMADAGMSPVKLDDLFTAFRVTFPNEALLDGATVEWINSLGQVGLTPSQHTALAVLRRGEPLTNGTYRTRCNLDSTVARTELLDLVTRGLAEKEGATSSTWYRLSSGVQTSGTRAAPADRRTQILRFMGRERVTRAEVQAAIGLSPQGTRKWLKQLQRENRIKLDGPATSNKARYFAIPPFVDDGSLQLELPLDDGQKDGPHAAR